MSSAITHSGIRTNTFIPATRIQRSFVAAAESRALIWLAARTPTWISSDHLTLLGFFSQAMVGVCYAMSRLTPHMLLVGIFFLALNWLGDSLDGTLARVRNRQRPRYGFYVDHVTDTIGAFFLTGGLALSGYVHPVISLGLLAAFLTLSIEAYLATYTLSRFQLSYWKFGPTEIRILLAIGNVALFKSPTIRIFNSQVLLFDVGSLIAIVGMTAILMVSAVRHTKQLYREERIS